MSEYNDSMMTSEDEDVITTANKYVTTLVKLLQNNQLGTDERKEIEDKIKYVRECVELNDIDSLQKLFTESKIEDCDFDEDEDIRFWFWIPLEIVS